MNASSATLVGLRTADWYRSHARRAAIVLAASALACASIAALAATRADGMPLGVISVLLVMFIVFRHPHVGVYLLFGAALLFEQSAIAGVDSPTAGTHIYANLSTYTSIPLRLSVVDLLMGFTLIALLARAIGRHDPIRSGPFGWAVGGYVAVFIVGLVIGIARGGAWNADVALNELRGPVVFGLAYFLAANLMRDRLQLAILLWLFAALVGVKALQGILSYQSAQEDILPYGLEAVTGHEDVVFFDLAIALPVVMLLFGVRTKLTYVLLALLPLILTTEVLTQRRAGFIALGVVLLVVLMVAIANNPWRGLAFTALVAVALAGYVALFWRDSGPLGEPTRALRAIIEPGSVTLRDAGSDRWREVENRNIAYTIRQLPLTGVGLGQMYLLHEPAPVPPFEYWQYITHNAVLWLWLKAGPVGGFALWFLVGGAVISCSSAVVRLADPSLRIAALVPLGLIVAQIIFS
ncbi:MAG: hypothetical protein AUH85_11675, partial [Chloroflexi bacterium 13_1_40CM_4_68_4]